MTPFHKDSCGAWDNDDVSQQAAGWYEDPWKVKDLRYWDGREWTPHTSDRVGSPAHSQPSVAAAGNRAKGSDLERRVAALLESLGYTTRLNVVLTGRSGATHEIDVIGEKSDQLTTFTIAVECKAWEHPIEKDVVAKFAYVLGDLGLRKGVIACLSGYRSGAATAASESGIELWGPDELRQRLGQVALADISSASSRGAISLGFSMNTTLDHAMSLARKQTKGRLGFGSETIAWTGTAWLPVVIVQVAVSAVTGRMRKVEQIFRVWNVYELVGRGLVASYGQQPALSEVELAPTSIRARIKQSTVRRDIEQAVSKFESVSTEAARARHAATLSELGVPSPYRAVPETMTDAFLPVHLILARRDGERLLAVDAHSGLLHQQLTASLSRHSQLVRESFA